MAPFGTRGNAVPSPAFPGPFSELAMISWCAWASFCNLHPFGAHLATDAPLSDAQFILRAPLLLLSHLLEFSIGSTAASRDSRSPEVTLDRSHVRRSLVHRRQTPVYSPSIPRFTRPKGLLSEEKKRQKPIVDERSPF